MSKKYQKQIQLKNGLKVLLLESHKSPVISVQMWVRNGSADEKKKEEGISHFIEHLVFKGTQKYKVGEIAAMIEGSGGELNAYTSFDQTVFYVTISKQFIESGLSAISEMMGFPQFDPKEIDNEREVVIEEIKRGQDSLGRQASQLLFSTAYSKHPYSVPVIGYAENIKNLKVKKIIEYYQGRYSPKNMFLIVSGDFDTKDMQKQITTYFSSFLPSQVIRRQRTQEAPQKKPRIKAQKADFKQSILYWAWKIPHAKHKDIPALDVLALILGQGDSSRLTQKLRLENPIVNSVGSFTFSPTDDGLFAISCGLQKEKLDQTLSLIREEIKNIFLSPPGEEEIHKAQTILQSEKTYSLETVDGVARAAGHYEFLMGDKNYFDKYIKQVNKITSLDLQRVAKKYLTNKKSTLVCLSDADAKTTQKILQRHSKGFFSDEKTFKTKNIKTKSNKKNKTRQHLLHISRPNDTEMVLENGIKVIFQDLPDTKVISIKAGFLGGVRAEPQQQEGLTELLAKAWLGGTKNKSEIEIAHEIDSLAAGVSPISGRNSIGLSAEGLSEQQQRLAEIVFDILLNPTFPSEIIDREKTIQLQQIKSRQDNPTSIASLQFMKEIFNNHPYSRDLLGSETTVAKLRQEDIRAHYEKMMQGKNMTLVVAGQIDHDFWKAKMAELSKAILPGNKFAEKFPLQDLTEDKRLFTPLKKEQSHVLYGFRGLTIDSKEKETLQVIQSILAGQGGRLFVELRDKASLAYSVSPMKLEGIEGGYFGAYIGCSPEKANKAISMMKEQFEKLTKELVSEDELLRAQRYLIGRHDIELQRTSAIATTILYEEIYGLNFKEALNISEKIFSVTAADVLQLSKKIFLQKSVISVVGPESPWKNQDQGTGNSIDASI